MTKKMSWAFFFVASHKISKVDDRFSKCVLIEMSNRFQAVGLFCWAVWDSFPLPCRPLLQFFSKNSNFFLLFSESFQFPRSQFPVGCGDFLFFPAVFSLFSSFPSYTHYNKEDFHYEHHYRHRPRLLRSLIQQMVRARR